jgi:hypothetical protein
MEEADDEDDELGQSKQRVDGRMDKKRKKKGKPPASSRALGLPPLLSHPEVVLGVQSWLWQAVREISFLFGNPLRPGQARPDR